MKKLLLSFLTFFSFFYSFSQSLDYVNEDNGKSYENEYETNGGISIPLYNIKIDNVSIPIFLSYNNKGRKTSDVPSSVGYNWKLNAGGVINKRINHLVDESDKGWFFNDPAGLYQSGFQGTSAALFESTDAAPDIFMMNMSNGDFLNYTYNWEDNNSSRYLKSFVINSNDSYSGIINRFQSYSQNNNSENRVYQDNEDFDIKVKNRNGINYLFRRGLKRLRPWDLKRYHANNYIQNDSANYTNYYIHKVHTDFNNDVINFEYKNTDLSKFILHSKATRLQTNSNPNTPPASDDPIVTQGYYSDISVEDVSRKEVTRITTRKETIEFLYKKEVYGNNFSNYLTDYNIIINMNNQEINILDQINILDNNGNYIKGYKFHYTNPREDQSELRGDFKLIGIERIGANQKDSYVYKKFDYYNETPVPEVTSFARDVYGYPNGATNNDGGSYDDLVIRQQEDGFDRMPNLDSMKKGMLKSVTSSKGGTTEFIYEVNKSGDFYFGGLLVNRVNTYDLENSLIAAKEYFYENPEGYGLPLFESNQQLLQRNVSSNDRYQEGFYDDSVMEKVWQTYFTQIDPRYSLNLTQTLRYNVSSFPVAQMRNAITSDGFIQNLNLDRYSQQESGSFYKQVTQRSINVTNGIAEKGSTISYYRPSLSGLSVNKVLERTEYISSSGNTVKKVQYNYEFANKGVTHAFKWDNVHLQENSVNTGLRRYVVKNLPIYNIVDILRSIETLDYDNSGNPTMNNKKEFIYFNEENSNAEDDYKRVKEVIDYSNGELLEKSKYLYLSEIMDNQQDISYDKLFHKNPVIEESAWTKINNEWKLKTALVTDYFLDGKVKKTAFVRGNSSSNTFYSENNYTPSSYNSSNELVTLAQDDIVEYTYDSNGDVLVQKNLQSGVSIIYQRSNEYGNLYADAVLTSQEPYNPSNGTFLKKSFENLIDANVIKFNKAFSGDYVFSGSSLSLGTFPNNYLISFWSYENSKWKYNSQIHNGGSVTINKPSSAIYIDEVRVQPILSSMESYTTHPLIGITSSLDDRGDGNRIEYDIYGSQLYILDKDGNVLSEVRKNNKNINLNN